MHERAPRGRFCLSEYAPNHAWRTKGGISGKSHIRKWAICRKNENLTLWKCARMHERAPRGRFLLSEYAPNHAWHTKGGINGKSHIRKCIICRKNENFTVWKCMKRRLVGKKAIFQYSTLGIKLSVGATLIAFGLARTPTYAYCDPLRL